MDLPPNLRRLYWRTAYQDEQIAEWVMQRLPPNRQIKGRCAIDEAEWDDNLGDDK